jgi:hypothetical protein
MKRLAGTRNPPEFKNLKMEGGIVTGLLCLTAFFNPGNRFFHGKTTLKKLRPGSYG